MVHCELTLGTEMKVFLLVALYMIYVRAMRKTFLLETDETPSLASNENMFDYANTKSGCAR